MVNKKPSFKLRQVASGENSILCSDSVGPPHTCDTEVLLSDPGSDPNRSLRLDLLPGFKKYGLKPPPKRQTIAVLKKNLREELNKYDYFYEGQSYKIVSPKKCGTKKKRSKCGGHKRRRNRSSGHHHHHHQAHMHGSGDDIINIGTERSRQ